MRSITLPTSAWNSNFSFLGSADASASAVASAMRRTAEEVDRGELAVTKVEEEGATTRALPAEGGASGAKAAAVAAEKRAQRAARGIFIVESKVDLSLDA